MIESLSVLVGKNVEVPGTVLIRGFAGKSTDTANCLIKAYSVFSICKGTVIAVGQNPSDNSWCVTAYVGVDKWIRYCGLSSTGVIVNQSLDKGTFIGYGTNGQMLLEYCTAEKSNYPVRLLKVQLYKHNPATVLFSKVDILGE